MTKRTWLVVSAVGIVCAGTAQAGFRVDSPEHRPQVHPGDRQEHVGVPDDYPLTANGRLSHVEITGDGEVSAVQGFGEGIPMDVALELLLPENWLAYTAPEIDTGTAVWWDAEITWLQALHGIGVRNQLRFFVDFNNKVVRVNPMPNGTAMRRIAYDHSPTPGGGEIKTNPVAVPDQIAIAPTAATVTPLPAHEAGAAMDARAETVLIIEDLERRGLIAENETSEPWEWRTLPDGTQIRQIIAKPPGAMTLAEFYNEVLVINASGLTLTELFALVTPSGWRVDSLLDEYDWGGTRIRHLTAEQPRGALIHRIEKDLGLDIRAYPRQRLLLITEAGDR